MKISGVGKDTLILKVSVASHPLLLLNTDITFQLKAIFQKELEGTFTVTNQFGVVLVTIDNNVLDYIVDKAIDFKLGARGLRSICETIMIDVMFDMSKFLL